ncbi:MAG: hypothetical protein JXA81_02810 [Sedimentisphaerales bacterium]|nr:hypothetical protein [Sedimentisphaerales bacterium]
MTETQDSKFDVIQRPPKIYLDTNHLINIAKVRKGQKPQPVQSEDDYGSIDECIKSFCGLIFNPVATMDWVGGKATEQSISEIAAVVDSANLKYIALDADFFVYTREILDQCRKEDTSIITPPDLPPVLQKISDNHTIRSPLVILANKVPDYLDAELNEIFQKNGGLPTEEPVFTVQEWVKGIFKQRRANPQDFQRRINRFKDELTYDIQNKEVYFQDSKRYRRDWIKRLLKIDKILIAFNPGINVDAILEKIDIEDCPAITLYWTVREKRMLSGLPPNDNDVDDYAYIPVIPYADVVLIEKQLRAFVLQAEESLESKVFSKVSDALNALENQGFTW